MKEILFKNLVEDYLLLDKIKKIEIFRDGSGSAFDHRAELTTKDGERIYLIINS